MNVGNWPGAGARGTAKQQSVAARLLRGVHPLSGAPPQLEKQVCGQPACGIPRPIAGVPDRRVQGQLKLIAKIIAAIRDQFLIEKPHAPGFAGQGAAKGANGQDASASGLTIIPRTITVQVARRPGSRGSATPELRRPESTRRGIVRVYVYPRPPLSVLDRRHWHSVRERRPSGTARSASANELGDPLAAPARVWGARMKDRAESDGPQIARIWMAARTMPALW